MAPEERRSSLSAPDIAGHGAIHAVLETLRRRELPRDRGHHHAGGEQEAALEPQRALVVQDLLPPVAEDVLGDVDGDEVARVAGADRLDVIDDRPRDLAVGT